MKKILLMLMIVCMLCLYGCGSADFDDGYYDYDTDEFYEDDYEDYEDDYEDYEDDYEPDGSDDTVMSDKESFGIEGDVHITYVYDGSIEELVHIRFTEDGYNEKHGIINKDGKFVYVCENSDQYIVHTPLDENDIGFIYSDKGEPVIFINGKGEEIRTFDGEEIDYVLGCGGGKALVYKYEKTIDSTAHMYGIIDSSGEWYMEMTELEAGPYNPSSALAEDYYIGEGVFFVHLSDGSPRIMFDTQRNNIWYLDVGYKTYNLDVSFEENKKIYFIAGGGYMDNCYISDEFMWNMKNGSVKEVKEDIEEECKVQYNFVLNPDGSWEEITDVPDHLEDVDFENYSDVYVYREDGYLKIYNCSKNKEYVFTEYASDLISRVLYKDGYIFIEINGKDGNDYFTYIDKECNMQFEPIEYSGTKTSLCKDQILYDNRIININGDQLFDKVVPNSITVDAWGNYYDGLVWIKDADGDYYFIYPENGKTVLLDELINQ